MQLPGRASDLLPSPFLQRRLAFIALFVGLSLAVPWLIHERLGGQLPSGERLAALTQTEVLGLILMLLLVYFVADGARLYFTLRALGYRVPPRAMAQLVFVNLLVSNLTPMATGGGLAQVAFLRASGVHLGAATAATTLRTLFASLLIFVPAPLLLARMDALQTNPLGPEAKMAIGLVAALYVLFFAVVLGRMTWCIASLDRLLALGRRLGLMGARRQRQLHFAARREMIRFQSGLRRFFRGPPLMVLAALGSTLVFLLALFSFPALLLWALGYSVDYLGILGLAAVTTFILYFAPTPGAAGVAEGAFGLIFAQVVAAPDLVLLILAWRFFTIYLGMLIGVPVLLHLLAQRGPAHA